MRIVIDMQGAQTESRFRGIGRYTMAFAQAVVRNRGEHEIILALSGLFPDTIEPIRASFDGLLPQENILVWHAVGPVREELSNNDGRRGTAELLREAFFASLQPDLIHICSLFEGYADDAVTSIGRFDTQTPVSVILYDLIPLLNSDNYLKPNPRYEKYYYRKVESLKQASLYLAISDYSRQEAVDARVSSNEDIINISTAIDDHFRPQIIDTIFSSEVKQKFSIHRSFVLYTGGADERKNLPRLIEAYAALPAGLRSRLQLVFAGKMPKGNIAHLRHIAKSSGLTSDELIFTGYINDEELAILYSLSELYVFPSWHEGFGLPALEAMACGAAAIGAKTTSLPEVIGLAEALFDPLDIAAMTQKMKQALEDDSFRARLREHGLQQAKKFSWDETAQRALKAWEALPRREANSGDYLTRSSGHERLVNAIVTHLDNPNEPDLIELSRSMGRNESSGIERQLLLDVSELHQRDAATGVQRVVRSYLHELLKSPPLGFRVEPVYATPGEGYRYARSFTLRFLGQDDTLSNDEPMRWQHGDIFLGLDMQHQLQVAHTPLYRQLAAEGVVVKFLVHDLLPIQLADLFEDSNLKDLHEQWLAMIAATDGAICVSKATADAFDDWIYRNAVLRAPTFSISWVHLGADIDGPQSSRSLPDNAEAVFDALRQRPTFLCVSTLEPRKRQQQILEAAEQLWQGGTDINLVLVGQQGWKAETLATRLRGHEEAGNRLFWLQGISDQYLEQVYAASTCLIAASLNEGFGLSLIEAARNNLPILARDIPVFREVAGEHADYFDGELAEELAEALATWLEKFRTGAHTSVIGMKWSTWEQSTKKLKATMLDQHSPRRQLLVDVSELVQHDAGTGIQRVVRSVLKEWLCNPPEGYRVEPIYATVEQGYRYARRFTEAFLGRDEGVSVDEPIDYASGDIFFGLDLQPQVQLLRRDFYQELRLEGVKVKFMVYDLLSVLMPQYFPLGSGEGFSQWLSLVAENDGAVCISNAVADELNEWFEQNKPKRERSFSIDWFHLGADVNHAPATQGFPPKAEATLALLRHRPSFLMVGTLEPRKGYTQVLDAFEQLRQNGIDVNLVIVGKQGWMVEELAERLRSHSELNKRLFWFEGISDEYLEKVYAASTYLIAASYGEGFGLPLIEAAQHKLPIIARDIPVFCEVAGEHAFYFENSKDPQVIAKTVMHRLELDDKGKAPQPTKMPWLTWKESSARLLKLTLHNEELHR